MLTLRTSGATTTCARLCRIVVYGEQFPTVDQLQLSAGRVVPLVRGVVGGDGGGHAGLLPVAVLAVPAVAVTAAAVARVGGQVTVVVVVRSSLVRMSSVDHVWTLAGPSQYLGAAPVDWDLLTIDTMHTMVLAMSLSLHGQYLLHVSHSLSAAHMLAPRVNGEVWSVGTVLGALVAAIDDDVDDAEQADHEDTAQAGAYDDDGLVVVQDGLGLAE